MAAHRLFAARRRRDEPETLLVCLFPLAQNCIPRQLLPRHSGFGLGALDASSGGKTGGAAKRITSKGTKGTKENESYSEGKEG